MAPKSFRRDIYRSGSQYYFFLNDRAWDGLVCPQMVKSMGYMHDILGVLISSSLHVSVKNALLTFNQFIFVSVSSPNEGLPQCLSS